MNPVFWLLVLLIAVALWFILTFVFIPLGNTLLKKWNKTIDILNKETEEEMEEAKRWEEKQEH